jgi:polar amino acid transport system substrate-binding protein
MSEDMDTAVRELAPTGVVRATINLGNIVLAQRDSVTGALGGVSVDLAHALAARLGLEVELFVFDTSAKAFAALAAGDCDVGFLAIDSERATAVEFTQPYVIIEATYLVPDASGFRELEDVDREGVRIAAGKNTAYDLHLSRSLKHAKLVHRPTSEAAIDLLFDGETDVAAGVRQSLEVAAAGRTGFHQRAGPRPRTFCAPLSRR